MPNKVVIFLRIKKKSVSVTTGTLRIWAKIFDFRVFARSLAQTCQFSSKAELAHLAPTRADVLLAT